MSRTVQTRFSIPAAIAGVVGRPPASLVSVVWGPRKVVVTSWKSVQQPDGTHRNTWTIESEPLPATGEPWRIEYPGGTVVTRLRRVR